MWPVAPFFADRSGPATLKQGFNGRMFDYTSIRLTFSRELRWNTYNHFYLLKPFNNDHSLIRVVAR